MTEVLDAAFNELEVSLKALAAKAFRDGLLVGYLWGALCGVVSTLIAVWGVGQ